MASTAAICNSYKQEILQGIHLAGDTYKVALYTSSATLSKSTTAYTTSNEVTGTNYTAGGVAMSGFTTGLSTDTAWIDWATDPSWANSTITAVTALVYNNTESNKAVAVFTFSSTTSTNGTFTLVLPAAGASATITLA